MWDTQFEESMLDECIIVHCKEECFANELMEILEKNGVVWISGRLPTSDSRWKDYGEETCYFIESKRISIGTQSDARPESYGNFIKCTFDGKSFEPADDNELMAFLGL